MIRTHSTKVLWGRESTVKAKVSSHLTSIHQTKLTGLKNLKKLVTDQQE
jgi:hypothetical protein